jgi:hypothetical protein
MYIYIYVCVCVFDVERDPFFHWIKYTNSSFNIRANNIPFAMLLRAIRYCSAFELYIKERETLRMTLLSNKYPDEFIDG